MSGNHEDVMKAAVAERLRAAMKQRRARGLDRWGDHGSGNGLSPVTSLHSDLPAGRPDR